MSDYISDLPPEYCQYHDEGCEFAESCLNCHLPVCVYDEPGGKQKLKKKRRAADMARLFTQEGKSIKQLAQIFGVNVRTVQRALKLAFGDTNRVNTCCAEDIEDYRAEEQDNSPRLPEASLIITTSACNSTGCNKGAESEK
jgi:AraC-like DNA-binding protein